jgi:hypothetical protein
MSSTQTVVRAPRVWDSGQPVDLAGIANLVGDEDVLDAAAREDLSLAHLLAANPDRAAQALLQLGHIDRLVHLAVRTVAHSVCLGVLAQLFDVALQRVEIEHQARRLDVGFAHAGERRDIIADLEIGERIVHCMHGAIS